MRYFRHTSILAVFALCLLALIGSSFATCVVTAEDNCCEDDHDCNDPVCPDGAVCHCACAYSGILTTVNSHDLIPTISGEISVEPSMAFVPQFTSDLFRPPRIA